MARSLKNIVHLNIVIKCVARQAIYTSQKQKFSYGMVPMDVLQITSQIPPPLYSVEGVQLCVFQNTQVRVCRPYSVDGLHLEVLGILILLL